MIKPFNQDDYKIELWNCDDYKIDIKDLGLQKINRLPAKDLYYVKNLGLGGLGKWISIDLQMTPISQLL